MSEAYLLLEVRLSLAADGRTRPIVSGYRPNLSLLPKPGNFCLCEVIMPGREIGLGDEDDVDLRVICISSEVPRFVKGAELFLFEGKRRVGQVVILQVRSPHSSSNDH